MKIHFIKSAYGIYGGGLDEPFRYFGRIISDKFQAEKIEFSFDEIEIQLASFSSKVNDPVYIEWYNKLPIYYRGRKMVRIILPVPHKEKELSDVFELTCRAFDIFASKKKKTDVFDADKVRSTLSDLEKELQSIDLPELSRSYATVLRQETITRRIGERTAREQIDNEKTRLIYDIRFYYSFENVEARYFLPYDNRFCNRILVKLRERKFRLPGYTHLYIMVSDSFENALYRAVKAETWYVYGIAVLENYADYPTMHEDKKKRIVFDLIKQGLNDIAKIDKLDHGTLNEVLNEVENDIFFKR